MNDHRKTYWFVWATLILLTAITVWTSTCNFGVINIVVTILIASTKATLVALFFMHLYYTKRLNAVVFASSILFVLIFIGLTASDMLDRGTVKPLVVSETLGGAEGMGDVAKFNKSTPKLLADGKMIFETQCSVCHGMSGKGDGPAAASLTPRPRDFTLGEWKNGGKPTQIFQTITHGLGAMPSFAALPVDQRWSLVHYIRSFSQNRQEDTAEDIIAATVKPKKTAPQIPVRLAMRLIAKSEPPTPLVIRKSIPDPASNGGQLYHGRCASCHGLEGQGGIRVRVLGSNPFSYLSTRSFSGSDAGWTRDLDEFIQLNSAGLPGFGKPGISDLTPAQWQSVYSYVQQLAGVR